MTFAWPHLLWLTLIPIALLAWDLTRRRRTIGDSTHPKILRAEAGRHALRLSTENSPLSIRSARPWLALGLIFCVVALARPQWGRIEEPVFDQAREILIAIDLSRSMLTPDVKPSRLDRAKLLTQSLLERLDGERIGLVVFSGTAFLQSPLSADYEILREFLPALGPDFLPEGGTNYRALIDTALSAFGSTGAADRFLIILSDGEATDENWRDRVPELQNKGIRVIGLGVGTAAGAMIPDGSGGLVKDERGAVVLSKLEPATLRELANSTNGVYQDASAWIDLASLIQSTVEAGQRGEFLEKNTVRLVERFQWPLALGVWCLLLSLLYEFPVRPKPRDLTLRSAEPKTKNTTTPTNQPPPTVAALAFLILAPCVLVPNDARAADAQPQSEAPLLSRIVSRLSESEQRTARDWAEFSRETITWGTRLQSSQQPVPQGPVRDALAAVDLGSKLDPKTADWPKLREELEALLQQSEDEQQQQQQDQQNQDQQNPDQQQKDQQKQSPQDQQKQDSSEDQQQPQQNDSPSQDQPQQKDQPQQQESSRSEQSPQKEESQSAFGDMKEPPPPPPEETQKVGGVPEQKDGAPPPTDPALALPLQKLEQLKNQDSPAELFRMMQEQTGETPKTPKKDW